MGIIGEKMSKFVSLGLFLMMTLSLGGFSFAEPGVSSPNAEGTGDARNILSGNPLGGISGSMGPRPVTEGPAQPVSTPSMDLKPTTLLGEGIVNENADDIGPLGSTGPTPTDAPFQDPDILVYNNPYSQTNPSIGHDSSSNLYTAFDHTQAGDSDVYVARSTDSGATWASTVVANSTSNESCPSIGIDYSPKFGTDMSYVVYNANRFEFAWSNDGNTWNIEDLGGGMTAWEYANCPYVAVKGDFIVIVAEFYSTSFDRHTWNIMYTLDAFETGVTYYYWNMWGDVEAYNPRVTIIDNDEIAVTMDIYDPDPTADFYEAALSRAVLTGDLATDSWDTFYYLTGVKNEDFTNPALEANGREFIIAMGLYDPDSLPLNTHYFWCLFTDNLVEMGSTSWEGCAGTGFLAYDPDDQKDQKYVMFHREGTAVHAVWMNGTDINYYYSPDGGASFAGDPSTEEPYKVNQPGNGTAIDAYHSPDITVVAGKPGVVWHDTRNSGSIYYNTWGDFILYIIDTYPVHPNLGVAEVGDVLASVKSYLWQVGSTHDIEATPYWDDGQIRCAFSYWWFDGSVFNPLTYSVGGANVNNTAIFSCDYVGNRGPISDPGGPYSGRKNFQVQFDGFSSYDPDGTIVSHEWDFGDSSPPAFGPVVTHTYNNGGVFIVTLNVTDNNGSWSEDTTTATIADMAPGAAGVSDAALSGGLLENVEITWSLSPDDGGVENDVDAYVIYYGTSYDPNGAGYLLLDAVSSGSTSYVHMGGGHGDTSTIFYQICAVDDNAQSICSPQQASKYTRHFTSGMQLMSIPLSLSDTSTPNVFQTLSFNRIIYYDAMAGKRNNWKTFDTRRPYSDLLNVDNTMALWVDVSADSWFTVSGLVPLQTTIHLVTGWNFVGYSSFFDRTVGDSLAGASYQTIETFDPTNTPWLLKRLGDTDIMQGGEGYWIHLSDPFDWTLTN